MALSFWLLVLAPFPHLCGPRRGNSFAATTSERPPDPLRFLFVNEPSLDYSQVRLPSISHWDPKSHVSAHEHLTPHKDDPVMTLCLFPSSSPSLLILETGQEGGEPEKPTMAGPGFALGKPWGFVGELLKSLYQNAGLPPLCPLGPSLSMLEQ